MGSRTEITVYAPDEATAFRGTRAAFDRLRELEDVMTDYREDSELMRLCAEQSGTPVEVSDDLWRVLKAADAMARSTDGRFDHTVGPIVQLWRRASTTSIRPDEEAWRDAFQSVGWHRVEFDDGAQRITMLAPSMRLDLGGIGKGFAADEAVRVLDAHGLPRCLVNLGGDIVAGDAPPGQAGWRVSTDPINGAKPVSAWVRRDAIATSGDRYRTVIIDGTRYAHLIDPRTGQPLRRSFEVTVRGPDGATADAWASAWSVAGPDDDLEAVARRSDVSVRIRWVEGDEVRNWHGGAGAGAWGAEP
ncbi:MAG: FAD:protein FMN transferase [Planctomycetota bacterium]